MAEQVREVGRNEPCPCGSGRKYKQCHATKSRQMSRSQLLVVILLGAVLVGGLMLSISNRQEHVAQPGGVWSEEHGHYH
jgi:hypothetical protein